MTKEEAYKIIEDYNYCYDKKYEDDLNYLNALNYLIEQEEDNSNYLLAKGAFYYEHKNFNEAIKYYVMSASKNNYQALTNLGYIYYYGRCGEKNYEKAFNYYNEAAKANVLEAKLKLADMYKNGYYVDKDNKKALELVKEIYEVEKENDLIYALIPECALRLGGYYIESNQEESAINILKEGKEFLKKRMFYESFFGNFTIMDGIVSLLYSISTPDVVSLDIYDLFYILKTPIEISFIFNETEYLVTSFLYNDKIMIHFLDDEYTSIKDFLSNASINDTSLRCLVYNIKEFIIS